ncbi:TPA: LOW QUALITY PROTEIN: hypothetical protein N0F65_012920 [Lagenidium giganteum]|uniref:SWIM-type domain-containing protein n=1 Tax=Lagenidium giganteum TaxID=4803 RepID=A0AAV2YS55_9STRA|nr:TPA: LOW QUALITY PROTEIN: hypothetical protein N0F65_012920 [Lagenidium giganteum]
MWTTPAPFALGVLSKLLSPPFQVMVRKASSALEAWSILERYFVKRNLHNLIHLRKKLHEFRMAQGDNMAEHMLKFDNLEMIVVLLGSVVSDYDSIVKIIKNKQDVDLLEAKQMHCSEYERMQEREVTESALRVNRAPRGKFGPRRQGQISADADSMCPLRIKRQHGLNDRFFVYGQGQHRSNRPEHPHNSLNRDVCALAMEATIFRSCLVSQRFLIQRLDQKPSAFVFHFDATYKTNKCGYPLFGCVRQPNVFTSGILCIFTADSTSVRYGVDSVTEGVRGSGRQSFDPPALHGRRRPRAVQRFDSAFGKHAQFLMCYFHVLQNVKKRIGTCPTASAAVHKCIYKMHFARSFGDLQSIYAGAVMEWMCHPSLESFIPYFHSQWMASDMWRWQAYHTPPGMAVTNNPIESFNRIIKDSVTLRVRLSLGALFDELHAFARQLSIRRPNAFSDAPPPYIRTRRRAEQLVRKGGVTVQPVSRASIEFITGTTGDVGVQVLVRFESEEDERGMSELSWQDGAWSAPNSVCETAGQPPGAWLVSVGSRMCGCAYWFKFGFCVHLYTALKHLAIEHSGVSVQPRRMVNRSRVCQNDILHLHDGKYFLWEYGARMTLAKRLLSPPFQVMVRKASSALEAWSILERYFVKRNLHNLIHLRKKLHEFRMAQGDNMAEHMLKFDNLEMIVVLLGSVVSDYDSIVKIIKNKQDVDLLEAKQMHCSEYERMQEREVTESALRVNRAPRGKFGPRRQGQISADADSMCPLRIKRQHATIFRSCLVSQRFLIQRLDQKPSAFVFHFDATYKTNKCGYPLFGCVRQPNVFTSGILCIFTADSTSVRYGVDSVTEGVRGSGRQSFDPPALHGRRRPRAVQRFDSAFGKHAQFLMCYFHVLQNVKKRIGTCPTASAAVHKCIYKMHFARSFGDLQSIYAGAVMEWMCHPSLESFIPYFHSQWMASDMWRWQAYHTPPGMAVTNNPIESFNRIIKDSVTLRVRLSLGALFDELHAFARQLSIRRPNAFSDAPPPYIRTRRRAEQLVRKGGVTVQPVSRASIEFITGTTGDVGVQVLVRFESEEDERGMSELSWQDGAWSAPNSVCETAGQPPGAWLVSVGSRMCGCAYWFKFGFCVHLYTALKHLAIEHSGVSVQPRRMVNRSRGKQHQSGRPCRVGPALLET